MDNFVKTSLKSPIGKGLFEIYVDYKTNIVYKKIKYKVRNVTKYTNILNNLKNKQTINKYILNPENIKVESNGSYYSTYIPNGIRLYDIKRKTKINDTIIRNILNKTKLLQQDLNDYVKETKLSGDWALHNLIYCLDSNKIYNVDLEGFYTYPFVHNNGNCDINYCNKRFDELIVILESRITTSSTNFFFEQFDNETLYISDLVYDKNEKKFIIPQNVLEVENYMTNYLVSTEKNEPTRIIENPTYIINSLDDCYSHALIDRIFPYFWSVRNIKGYNEHNITLFIKEEKLKKFPNRKKVIDNKTGKYKNTWDDLIHLLNPKEILFEHLLDKNEIIIFKKAYLYSENNKLCKWQRTFWNCHKNYPGRHINNVLYSDDKITSELDIFRNMVKQKYNIKDEQNNVKKVVIIDRQSDRNIDLKLLQTLDIFLKNLNEIQYNGIRFLEKKSFKEQIELFNSNDIILCRHGSCLTNMLWAKKGTHIIELGDNDLYKKQPQSAKNSVLVKKRGIIYKSLCDFTENIHILFSYEKIVEDHSILLDKLKYLI